MAVQQIILYYPVFGQFISFRFSFEKSKRENHLKGLQLQVQVFFNKENFPQQYFAAGIFLKSRFPFYIM